jgi:hypothetical protein
VVFKDGATTLGSRTLDAAGKASLETSSLSVGEHAVTVEYAGGGDFSASTSESAAHTVAPRPSAPTPTPTAATPAAPAPGPAPPVANPVGTRLAISHRTTPLRGRFVKVTIRCRAAVGTRCKGTLVLDPVRGGTRRAAAIGRYGKAKFDVAAGKNVGIKVKASSLLRTSLRKQRRVVVMATARYADHDAAPLTTERKLTVINPRKKPRRT